MTGSNVIVALTVAGELFRLIRESMKSGKDITPNQLKRALSSAAEIRAEWYERRPNQPQTAPEPVAETPEEAHAEDDN